jgi:6-phosphogluconolactonase
MQITVLADVEAVAREGAAIVAAEARSSIAARGRFIVALSGGKTPWLMLRALAAHDLPWAAVHVVQVDERVAPDGHDDRNLTHLIDVLVRRGPLTAAQVHAMPVGAADLDVAADRYASVLDELAGSPPALDLVHLGLGFDGHTASLLPGDPALEVTDRDVAVTGEYQGRRRMTLTLPAINRARRVLWIVTGGEKASALERLRLGDPSIPAGRVESGRAIVMADLAAGAAPVPPR